jgi:hypothetical protein
MVTCTVREIRRAGGRVVSAAPSDPEAAAMPYESFELPMDDTGITAARGDRPSGTVRSSGRS